MKAYMDTPSFESFGLGPDALAALSRKGFEEPTPIQALTIPRLLKAGPDLIARARTGTGKTAAFGIPFAELLSKPEGHIRAIVLVPTRELALQVTSELVSLRAGACPRVAAVYGGASMGEQLRRLGAGVDVVVGTPGRVLDHLGRGTLDLTHIEFLVLDEADEMLDMGFIEDIEAIMEKCGEKRRVVLFSATMPAGIAHVAKRRLGDYETVEDFSEAVATELAEQVWLEVREGDKLEALCRVMDVEEDFYGIVFTTTRIEAERVAKALEERGYDAEALHGDIPQDRRERILAKFREKRVRVLVATDVAARGIDIDNLSHVVNWSLPHDPEAYVHRVGRTGRAGNAGMAITLVTPVEYRKLFRFKRVAGAGFKKAKVPEVDEVLAARKDRLRDKILAKAELLAAEDSEGAERSGADKPVATGLAAQAEAATAVTGAVDPAGAPTAGAAGEGAIKKKKAARDARKKELWLELADEILASTEPRVALSAALFEAFGEDIDPERYRKIEGYSVDAAATARLFIGSGKRDKVTPSKLAALVKRLSGLPDRLIGGIEIYENFSFVTVPFEAAERVLSEARRSGGLPTVRFATPKGPDSRVRGPEGHSPHAMGRRPTGPRRADESPDRRPPRGAGGYKTGRGKRG
jgi:ATP-dependent RNA helicase DeaD